MVTRERTVRWGVDFMRYHGPNVVSCKIVTRLARTPLVKLYLQPSMLEHLPNLDEALQCFRDPIVMFYLNADTNKARSTWRQSVLALLVEYRLIDLV